MNKKIFYLILAIIALTGEQCSNKSKTKKTNPETTTNLPKDKQDSIPACVLNIIKNSTPPVTPVQVDEYNYKDRTVYLFTADCCDVFNTVYDQDCKPVCSPSGGITGQGDMQCTDFGETAKFVKHLWKK
jgi:hypothetical protein